MTTTIPDDPPEVLVCGCASQRPHRAGCAMRDIESIALKALVHAGEKGLSPLAALQNVLAALAEAGAATPHSASDDPEPSPALWDITCGLLDELWRAGFLAGEVNR